MRNRNRQVTWPDYLGCVESALADLIQHDVDNPDAMAALRVDRAKPVVREAYDNGVSVDAMAQVLS